MVGPSLLHSHLRGDITLFTELQQMNAGVLVHKEQAGKRTRCGKKLKNDICNMYTDDKKGLFFHLQSNRGFPLHQASCQSQTKPKQWVTKLFASNADGNFKLI